jgi:nucleotide-binding universal stress UspA family protein
MGDSAPGNALLVADGSADARAAETLLAGLSWPAGSAAAVLAAVRPRWTLLGLGLDNAAEVRDTLARLRRLAREAALATARDAARRLSQAGLATLTVVREGDAGHVALGFAAEAQPSLIALGAKGFDHVDALRLGPTALEVVRAARTSVLIARPARRPRPARILLAADGLMDWLAPDAWPIALMPVGAQITVAKLAVESEAAGEGEAAELRAVEFGEALQAQGLTVRNVFPHGEPRAALVRLARAAEADLVIVGGQTAPTTGAAPARSLVAAVTRYAPCSVLVVQPDPHGPWWPAQAPATTAAASRLTAVSPV